MDDCLTRGSLVIAVTAGAIYHVAVVGVLLGVLALST
jgi:hypothetical protein